MIENIHQYITSNSLTEFYSFPSNKNKIDQYWDWYVMAI